MSKGQSSAVLKFLIGLIFATVGLGSVCSAEEFAIHLIYRSLDMGNPGETAQKDYHMNMGRVNGLKIGSILTVYRKAPSYDVIHQKLLQDLIFPIAKVKVIHVESSAAIARLESMLPADKTAAITPYAIMMGDLVRLGEPPTQ